jgi:hypothetical protein
MPAMDGMISDYTFRPGLISKENCSLQAIDENGINKPLPDMLYLVEIAASTSQPRPWIHLRDFERDTN